MDLGRDHQPALRVDLALDLGHAHSAAREFGDVREHGLHAVPLVLLVQFEEVGNVLRAPGPGRGRGRHV
ncbi:hypothetical protein ACQ4WX_46670 [Streptomyces lasalocidi]